jgi:hypothetical protein
MGPPRTATKVSGIGYRVLVGERSGAFSEQFPMHPFEVHPVG